jgi:hypothetical protein
MESENVKHALATLRVDQNVTKKVPAVVGRRRLEVLCSKLSEANGGSQWDAALILAHVRWNSKAESLKL